MSINISEKLRQIRETENQSRQEFSEKIGKSKDTITNYEVRKSTPRTELIVEVLKVWPEYTLWLMTDKTEPEVGQISPEIKRIAEENQREVG